MTASIARFISTSVRATTVYKYYPKVERTAQMTEELYTSEYLSIIFKRTLLIPTSSIRKSLNLNKPSCPFKKGCILEGELLVYSDKVCSQYVEKGVPRLTHSFRKKRYWTFTKSESTSPGLVRSLARNRTHSKTATTHPCSDDHC